ncbi:FeS-binding protein, partial [Streptomyces sp. SID6137]|nr:FeS-binding protein [Streptomyces sp. SID6137]
MPTRPSASRRTVLRGAAVVPVAGLGLAACSGPGGSGSAATPTAPVDLGAESDVAKGGAK